MAFILFMIPSCGKDSSAPVVPAAPILSTIANSGAAGTPSTGVVTHNLGDQISYSHYSNLPTSPSIITMLDGIVVSSNGNINMDSDHFLWSFGNPTSGIPFTNMMAVPSDFTAIPYPKFYQTPTSFNLSVVDPYCTTNPKTIAYPASYLGAFPFPDVIGAPLPVNIKRGANVKDYWQYGITNPATNAGCTGDLHTAFISTLARLKKMGVDQVGVFRDTQVADFTALTWQILPSASWSISDTEMAWIVGEANKVGVQIYEYRQVVETDVNNVVWSANPTLAEVTKFLDAYITYIVGRAVVAEQNGVAAFQLDYGYLYWPTWSPAMEMLFISKMVTAAQQVRAVYSGKIMYGQTNKLFNNVDECALILKEIDVYIGDLTAANHIASNENSNPTVSMMKQKYLTAMSWYSNMMGTNKKPILWKMQAQSHRYYLRDGWIEDGFCVSGCMQNNVQIDFSVQAIAYEAMLEAINQQNFLTVDSVVADTSWYVDILLPKDSFPNLSQSFRNKPAESILYKWYAK